MKISKNVKWFAVSWMAAFALFNVLAFASPAKPGVEKYTASFWIGYSLIVLSFIGLLVCVYHAFKNDKLDKVFYSLPSITASYASLISSLLIGGFCMFVSFLPYWIGGILCCIVLVANIVAIVRAEIAANIVEGVDQKVKTQTFFIKSLTVEADTLMAMAKSDAIKAECKKVYEAIRYSDPMSNPALAAVESQITVKFAELSDAVKAEDADKVAEVAREVVILVGDRNKKCMLLK